MVFNHLLNGMILQVGRQPQLSFEKIDKLWRCGDVKPPFCFNFRGGDECCMYANMDGIWMDVPMMYVSYISYIP